MSEFTKEGPATVLSSARSIRSVSRVKLHRSGYTSSSAWKDKSALKNYVSGPVSGCPGILHRGNFTKALEIFEQLAIAGDAPSHILKERCEDFLLKSPGLNGTASGRCFEIIESGFRGFKGC